jgi:hypothetical protein
MHRASEFVKALILAYGVPAFAGSACSKKATFGRLKPGLHTSKGLDFSKQAEN